MNSRLTRRQGSTYTCLYESRLACPAMAHAPRHKSAAAAAEVITYQSTLLLLCH
jgi:hypothetical protein